MCSQKTSVLYGPVFLGFRVPACTTDGVLVGAVSASRQRTIRENVALDRLYAHHPPARPPLKMRLLSTSRYNLPRSWKQEPSSHQRAAYREKRKQVGDPETELSCWLLEALAKESEGHYVKRLMYQPVTMETLARYGCVLSS